MLSISLPITGVPSGRMTVPRSESLHLPALPDLALLLVARGGACWAFPPSLGPGTDMEFLSLSFCKKLDSLPKVGPGKHKEVHFNYVLFSSSFIFKFKFS